MTGDERSSTRIGWAKRIFLGVLVIAGIALFVSLGIWQLHRLAWKLDLIRIVDERLAAEPVDAPGPSSWPELSAANDAYRRVRISGHFTDAPPAFVQAVTQLGPGFWVVEPFQTDRGFVVLINRGFVTKVEAEHLPVAPSDDLAVTGLLRITEPGGAFLRSNDPVGDRWYSRDVAAIAKARGLEGAAPYFVDADASATSAEPPVGGLTVVNFRNHHLVYALTWFGLAVMLAGWTIYLLRFRREADRK
ncbi:SURF1 family protein [Mesorhizobium sp. VNQ89]|uniref:SURF1 family protein n=1 Tax=Mesorhizobium quangtriensis TaxID=3157709 RepID=UPI0032B790BD